MAKSGEARLLGMIGEAIAERYLSDSGLHIVERNWRCDEGEIDLIARDSSGEIVVIEVKTRSSGRFGVGSEAITPEKYRRLHLLAKRWCKARALTAPYRLDVISIDGLAMPQLTHLKRVIL
jgi:putative endonuclease